MSDQPLNEQCELDARCDQPFLVLTLAAGAIATLGLLLAGRALLTLLIGIAITVAQVPPMCVFGLLLAKAQWSEALGAALLFAANLLGILSGVPITLAVCLPELRLKLWRSRLGLVKVHAHPDRHHAQIHDHRHAHPWRIVPMVEAAARSLP
jgi:uncharacterized membrane protein